MNVLIYSEKNTFPQHFIEQVQSIDQQVSVLITTNPSKEELQTVDVLLPMHNFSNFVLADMPHLKWVHLSSAGANGVVEKLTTTDILLTNSSGVHPIPIAEQIFAYILLFARGIDKTIRSQSMKTWQRDISTFELHGKTIVIVGLGRIGEKVAQLAKAFDMKVLAVKTKVTKENHVDEVFTLKNLDKALVSADFVVNCLPGTEETRGVYTLKDFKNMKPSAYFINIGRGFSVKEEDMITALQTGIIAGAALDVFEEEPLPSSSKLWSLPNVIITPHTAGKTPEYMNRVIDIFCTNLTAYLTAQKMPNEVDKEKGY